MNKILVFVLGNLCLWISGQQCAAHAQSVRVTSEKAKQAARFYGSPSVSRIFVNKGFQTASAAQAPVLGFSTAPSEKYRPQAVIAGFPLIEPRGMTKGNGFLYISDCGKDERHNEPPTIWRLEPSSRKLDIFYRGSLLTCSKWLWFLRGTGGRPDEVIVSDFGEELAFHRQGSGRGAKVFAIEVRADGSAGLTRVLHEGQPLRNPQGITVIGDTVILADTRAGEMAQRSDAPEVKFLNGVIFAIPLAGGQPTRLFPEQTFVTVVGACAYQENDELYLRIWDIDGGRRDTSSLAWSDHSGFAALKRAKVESVNPLKLGPLKDVPLVEEFPVTLDLRDFRKGQGVILRGTNDTTFSGGSDTLVLSPESVASGKATLIVESPTTKPSISIDVNIVTDVAGSPIRQQLEIRKDPEVGRVMRDNKHGGAAFDLDILRLDTTVDGLAHSIALFPPKGGVSAFVWQGEPLVAPMASHYSWDQRLIWVTDLNGGPDGTGAVWQVPVPSLQERAAMYSPGNAWRIGSTSSER